MSRGPGRVEVALGARAAEERLLAELELDQAACRADLARLGRPLYVLVPSQSLRLQLVERLAARPHAALGIAVRTLPAFSRRLFERAGEAWPASEGLLPILVRRLARAHPELASLADANEGWAALVAALSDLQHAGFEAALLEPLGDALDAYRDLEDPSLPRARALLALAARLERELEASGASGAGAWAVRTRELLRARPELVDARAIWIHGFSDAPGTTSEWIQALVERAGAHVVYDALALALPPGPSGTRFGEQHAQRLGVARPPARVELVPRGVTLEFVRALGARAEARAIASALRQRLMAGARAERLGVVVRQQGALLSELAAALRALGVPFSGIGAQGSLTPRARALHALADLVEGTGEARVVRALRAGWWKLDDARTRAFELLAACAWLGATRLSTLAALDLDAALGGADHLRLPGGRGALAAKAELEERDDEEELLDEPEERDLPADNRREVPRAALQAFQARAQAWLAGLDALPAEAPAPVFARALAQHVTQQFSDLTEDVLDIEQELSRELPPRFVLTRPEFLELFGEALRSHARSPLGGAGGGVQLLDALEARSRTFDELFVADLRQGSFPRTVREEPLLPDRLRIALTSVLPDLPIKSAGLAEEEALFAGLLESAPRVTLSWCCSDEEGRRLAPSPFVRRAWRELHGAETGLETAPLAAPVLASTSARSETEELAVRAVGDRTALANGLAEVLAAHGRSPALAAELARARRDTLDELEPARGARTYPTAFLGRVGAPLHARDPRRGELWVSSLESLARCPWQMLLGRMLGLAAPVPLTRIEAVLEPAHVGSVVHEVLRLVVDELQSAWPAERELRALCERAAEGVARAEGLAPAGMARLLALRARPFLAVARALDAEHADGAQAEVQGAVGAPGARQLRFRADRVEARGPRSAWIDFKTSRHALSEAVKPETRRTHLLAALHRGHALQAAAYAFGAGTPAVGSYLFLHPRIADGARLHEIASDDREAAQAFEGALRPLYAALDAGAFPPRLVDTDLRSEYPGCAHCDFTAACQRGDSGARTRTVAWVLTLADESGAQGFDAAFEGLWRMTRKPALPEESA